MQYLTTIQCCETQFIKSTLMFYVISVVIMTTVLLFVLHNVTVDVAPIVN